MKSFKKPLNLIVILAIFMSVSLPSVLLADESPVKFEAPEVMAVPERVEPKSDTDWQAKVNNKNAEVIEVLNILNPVAAFLTAAFEQFGDEMGEVTHEEWVDTQAHLTKALTLYGESQKLMEKEKFSKQLFLDLEETWQLLVKVGVAGIRTKSMVDNDLARMSK
ncbi:MAG: hypothetical protein GY839_02745 [candidate division Zixibacteria bacterium]|nr:hypothetical protein [candidate division Zixibacteria bacterium]